jgi:hypothetical protein
MKHGFFATLLNPSNSHCKFDDDDEVQEEVMTWFKEQAAYFYDSGIQKLVPRLNKFMDNAGDYIEK